MRLLRSVVFVTAAAAFMALEQAVPNALARDNGQWENSPPHVRRWFQGLRQPDNPRVSCCGEADAYEADIFEVDGGRYVAVITDGKGEIPNGTKIPVPNHKLKWDEGNPTGHGIIFIGVQGQVYCYGRARRRLTSDIRWETTGHWRRSTSLKARNGVGVRADGKVIFAISQGEVSFDAFARLFRDGLQFPNTLFLDDN